MSTNIFKNEFFECPSYMWGSLVVGFYVSIMILVLTLLDGMLGTQKEIPVTFKGEPVIDKATGKPKMTKRGQFAAFGTGVGGLINIAWFVYIIYRFFNRSPNCTRVGFKHNAWKSPFSFKIAEPQ